MPADIEKLIAGFKRFRAEHFGAEESLYDRLLREGQSPRTMVIGCCDSRVDPAIITDCDPGDLFVVRNVANLVPPYETAGHYHGTSAALEFAVRSLGIRHIVVLGHARCGGIRSLLEGIQGERGAGEFIRPWMMIAEEALHQVSALPEDTTSDTRARLAEQFSIRVSLRNLMSFPWVRTAVEAGMLYLHGWYFDMDQGELLRYDPKLEEYVPLR